MVHHEAMPELPEVETIRRQLDAALPDRRITKLRASWSKSLHGRGADLMAATGSRISEVTRRGKVLVLWTDQELALLVHLRMTGQLLIDEGLDREGPMTRAVIGLDRGQLVFNDQRKFGRIINITSGAVKAPIDILGLSNGARSGLTGFVAGVARSKVAARGVTINNLLPGAFDTDRLKVTMQGAAQKSGQPVEAIIEARKKTIPAQRLGLPAEFGAICAFLCSMHAGYVNGQNVLADGGTFPGTF